MIPPIRLYQAEWDAANALLKPPKMTCLKKIGWIFWDIISVLIPIIGIARLHRIWDWETGKADHPPLGLFHS